MSSSNFFCRSIERGCVASKPPDSPPASACSRWQALEEPDGRIGIVAGANQIFRRQAVGPLLVQAAEAGASSLVRQAASRGQGDPRGAT